MLNKRRRGSGCWGRYLLDGCTPVFSCDRLCCIVEEGDSIWIAGESNEECRLVRGREVPAMQAPVSWRVPAIERAGDMVNVMTDKYKSRTFGLFLSYGGQ